MVFSSCKSFDPATDIASLTSKVILVTGGNTGLGLNTIHHLSAHNPSHIYLAARTASKAEAAISTLRTSFPTTPITHLPLDLSSFSSITAGASQFLSASPRLDVLINNAGVMALPSGITQEGYEIQFGTNHMGHALLTRLLLPRMLETAKLPDADVRIVNLSSAGHQLAPRGGGIVFEGLKTPMENYLTWARYGQSKLANVLFTKELAKRYPAITSVAVHPGVIKTDLYASSSSSNPLLRYGIAAFGGLFMMGLEDGTKNQLWAATAPKGEVENGAYYTPVGVKNAGSAFARDEKLAERLWEWTEEEFQKNGV